MAASLLRKHKTEWDQPIPLTITETTEGGQGGTLNTLITSGQIDPDTDNGSSTY